MMRKAALWTLIVAVPLLTVGCEKNPLKTGFYKTHKTTQQAAANKQDAIVTAAANTNAVAPLVTTSQQSTNNPQFTQTAATTSEQQYKQGYDLFYGIGAKHDEKHGIRLLEQAASQGHINAKQLLARLDEMGYQINDAVLHQPTTQVAQVASTAIPVSNGTDAEQNEIITENDWYYSEDKAQAAATIASTASSMPQIQQADSSYVDQLGSVAAVAQAPISSEQIVDPNATIGQATTRTRVSATRHEQALLSMDQSFYTLQLVAARDKEGVDKFISENQLDGNAHIVKKNTAGTDWYVAYYGNYPNQQMAKAAASQLPSSVKRSAKPWVRPVRTVQEEINQNAG
ncbi:SPOR domain-containing protein [Candidatus Berkiella cookevillensis]|uniref:SPOR domain-containing protein n=1 Tax=Candidatus Berkiella cookevillensis TaxID=437022 RepID=A0A0Q9Y915_9GAMM|nr:SPOR domain-containing protein [Candidatus Berkiella cookevillensis]MCS5707729.1 SPOR domain-containing protein [Candidatus Berkiella cookevillensis]